jgi:hypothetical protein
MGTTVQLPMYILKLMLNVGRRLARSNRPTVAKSWHAQITEAQIASRFQNIFKSLDPFKYTWRIHGKEQLEEKTATAPRLTSTAPQEVRMAVVTNPLIWFQSVHLQCIHCILNGLQAILELPELLCVPKLEILPVKLRMEDDP